MSQLTLHCPQCQSDKLQFGELVPAHARARSSKALGGRVPVPESVPPKAPFTCRDCAHVGDFTVGADWVRPED